MDYFDTNNGGHLDYGCVNEGFMEENNNKRGTGRHSNNRFKVFHRKLDFSHVGSRVRIRLYNFIRYLQHERSYFSKVIL